MFCLNVYLLDERNLIPQPILSPGSDLGPNGEPTSRLRNKRPSPGQKAKESLTRPGKLSKLNKRLTIPMERVRWEEAPLSRISTSK